MHTVITSRFLSALVFFSLFLPVGIAADTLRDRSNVHFGILEWTSGKNAAAKEIAGLIVPGGNETFPVLSRMPQGKSDTAAGIQYPREVRLGYLDYRQADPRVISLLGSVSADLENSGLDADHCDPSRPFLPVTASFQLARLPPITGVLFSNPVESGENTQTAQFRLQCLKDSVPLPVYLSVTVSLVGPDWKISEFMFDGETYAGLAQPY